MISEEIYGVNISEEKLLKSLSDIIDCGVMRIKSEADEDIFVASCGFACDIAESGGRELRCREMHRYAGEHSENFGGKYIFFCSSGLVFIICPVKPGDYLICGPISPVASEDFDVDEIADGISAEQALEYIKSVPVVTPEKITHAANLLYVCAKHLGTPEDNKNNEIYEQQRQIGEYIQSVKASLIRESGYIDYPYDKEKLLVHAIVHNNLDSSRKYLNEILGHIFFSSVTNLDVIKVRAMELSVMISRAAMDGGADQTKISNINARFISEFFNYQTIEEVCWALTDILKKFTRETFEFSSVKHVDIISKAIAHIKANYTCKLTLNEVAEFVFLSPSYFSKVFKREVGCYFKDYVNYMRVEKSKLLLLTEKISLVEIADNAGFYDQSYFNKVCKKVTGVTPKKFRETGGKAPLKAPTFRIRL